MRRLYVHVCQYKSCQKRFHSIRKVKKYCSIPCSNKANGPNRKKAINDIKPVTVWSCGGGVESTAMAVLMVTGKQSKPDYAVMVDNGYEKEWTWQYVHGIIIPKFAQVGIDLNIIKVNDYSNNNLFDSTGHLIIPAYRMKEGKVSKLHTHCNGPWKATVIRRWMRSLGLERVESWLGISANERHRMRPSHKMWISHRYPLIELNMTRESCLWLIGKEGWPRPEHSSCYFCPQTSDQQWRKLIDESPGDWAKAVETDRYIRAVDPTVYIHRACVPLDEAIGKS